MNPLVSIIIPSTNHLDDLKKCVLSIQNQTFKDFEVLIIDAKSTDGTLDFLKTLTNPFRWVSESDKGVYDAMNKGVEMAKGKWLYFIGCDDKLFSNSTLVDIFENKIPEDIELMIGKVKYDLNGKDSFFIKKNDGVFSSSWSSKNWFKNSLHHQAIFYKKELFLNQKYSLKYKILSDYAFNLSLFKKGVKELMIDNKIAICGTNGMSKNYSWKLYDEEIDLKTDLSSVFLKPVFAVLSFGKYLLKKKI